MCQDTLKLENEIFPENWPPKRLTIDVRTSVQGDAQRNGLTVQACWKTE